MSNGCVVVNFITLYVLPKQPLIFAFEFTRAKSSNLFKAVQSAIKEIQQLQQLPENEEILISYILLFYFQTTTG